MATPPGRFNIWKGWGVEPQQGRWPLLRDHITLLAQGDEGLADYVMDWVAYGVQHPAEKLDVALLFVGEQQGGGKGTFGHLLRRIYGSHGLYLTQKSQVIGRFNAHLAYGLFAFVDEAFFGGDRAGASALKALISDSVLPVEPKFVDLFFVPNRLRLVFASNERHALHLDLGDRRIAAFEPDWPWQSKRERLDYFKALHAEIDGGGAEAFLHSMLERDITGFDPREIPATLLRAEQQLESLRGTRAWWFERLTAGESPWRMPYGTREDDEPAEVSKDFLYNDYVEWARSRRHEFKTDDPHAFWTTLRGLVAVEDQRRRGEDGRARMVILPPLAEARRQFERRGGLGVRLPWDGTRGDDR